MAVITFAHRGARADRPENTLPAFRFALERGARGLETDAWLAADGEVVLVHDERIRRGVRRLRVTEATAAQLAELDVPRLLDLYADCGTAFELSVDVKQPEAARRSSRRRGGGQRAPGRLWLCSGSRSCSPGSATRPRREARLLARPQAGRAPRWSASPPGPRGGGRRLPQPASLRMDAGLVALFHRFGLSTFAWDTQETRYILAALRMDMDGIYCDRVDRMVATVGEWSDATTDATD
jgi:glycerophosphoryl diester phosphodiesterase